MNYSVSRCLVIPDVHQDIAWVKQVFAKEIDCDLVVFLGDYFDTRVPKKVRTGVAATGEFLNETQQRLGARSVFLLGNHDIQYLEAKPACERYRTLRDLRYRCGSAYSHSAAAKIAKTLSIEFWAASRLCVVVNGWLLSHAGLSKSLWPAAASNEESLTKLDKACADALVTMRCGPHPLLQIGRARGGDADAGGITWQDFALEFQDNLPLPQIVGHTPSEFGARQKGRSWCLDGGQTSYGILENETVVVKTA